MAYEVTAASDASERLVVSVGGKTLVVGEPLDQDREAADAGELTLVGSEPVEVDLDLVSDLNLVGELLPDVGDAVKVEFVEEPVEETVLVGEEVTVDPVDPPDTPVDSGETTPHLERTLVDEDGNPVDVETGEGESE